MIEINADELGAWRHNPTTQKVLRFLHDYRERLKDAWASGAPLDESVQMQAQTLGFLHELTIHDIRGFYESEEDTSDAAAGEGD